MDDNQERMDAMTPSSDAPDREPQISAALHLMAMSFAGQVDLGTKIEQFHMTERRAHRETKLRLDRESLRAERIHRDLKSLQDRTERVRHAIAGEATLPDGDLLAEARELRAKYDEAVSELFAARTFLEAAPGLTGNWEIVRQNWMDRVRPLLNPEIIEEGNGESHS